MSTPPPSKNRPSLAKKFAEIERISVFGAVARMGPIGLWMYAEAFCRAAKSLPKPEVPYEPVRYYLICHSIELVLKAYLSLHGATMLELADSAYGHKLDAILGSAESKGLGSVAILSPEHHAEIHKASVYYGGKVFEYPAVGEAFVGYPGLPSFERLLEVAVLLLGSLEQSCKSAQ